MTADRYDETVRKVASEILGVPAERLRDESSMADLKATLSDYQLIFERSAEELGVNLMKVIETMPVYTVKAGDATMWSLRALAPFSARAAGLLDRYTVRPVDDTIGSIAASLRTGAYVDSGRKGAPAHVPLSAAGSLAWVLIPALVLLAVIPLAVGYIEFVQCRCGGLVEMSDYVLDRGFRRNGPLLATLPIFLLIAAFHLVPGLLAIRSAERLRRDREEL